MSVLRLLGKLANHNFCPNFDRQFASWLRQPLTILLLAAAISAAVGTLLHRNGFVLFAGIVAMIAVGIVWPWLSLLGIAGTLRFERQRSHEGQTNKLLLDLVNRSPLSPVGLLLQDGKSLTVALGSVTGWSNRSEQIDFVPLHRGVYPATDTYLSSAFPFGLLHARRKLAVTQKLIVWPKIFPVGLMPEPSGHDAVEGTVSRSRSGTLGDVLGVRPFRRGDSPRRIHWSQTARHDRLIVCELQSLARPVVHVILDVDTAMHRGSGPDSSREWAIRIAASFCSNWLEQGAEIALSFADKVFVAQGGNRQRLLLLDALATIDQSTSQPLPDLLAASDQSVDGLQVVVTTDLALCRMKSVKSNARFVVLRAFSFGEALAGQPVDKLPCVPWMVVDQSDDLAAKLRVLPREAGYGV